MCKLPISAYHRRIDIKVYTKESYATGLVYFTGSAHFNRSMRLWAKRHNIKLEDYGMREVIRDAKGHTIHKGKKLECRTERDVFRHLGLNWMEPTQRNGGATVAALTTT
jgi:DNA polymerase/3'-5' exonuclease PolX